MFNNFIDYISVRDADSQRALETAGVNRSIFRTHDPIFQLTVPPTSATGDRLALAVTPWPGRPGWEHDLALLADRLVDQLGLTVDLLVFYPAEDEALCEKVAKEATHDIRVRKWSEPEDLLKWIGEYQLVVGMRYHALALAALAEKPFVGWGFQKKVRGLCRDFGQPIWSFERGWEADAVFRQIGEAWRHREILPHRFVGRLPQLRAAVPVLNDVPRIYPSQV